jgi:ferredoxin like protein
MSDDRQQEKLSLEDKLYRTKYEPDSSNPHIKVAQDDGDNAKLKKLVKICPAEVYKQDPADEEKITVSHDNCLECGTCRQIVEDDKKLDWKYPDGGMGVKYRKG